MNIRLDEILVKRWEDDPPLLIRKSSQMGIVAPLSRYIALNLVKYFDFMVLDSLVLEESKLGRLYYMESQNQAQNLQPSNNRASDEHLQLGYGEQTTRKSRNEAEAFPICY